MFYENMYPLFDNKNICVSSCLFVSMLPRQIFLLIIYSQHLLLAYFQNIIDIDTLYNKALLCSGLCWSLLASQFLSNFCLIPVLYAQIPDFHVDIFLLSSFLMVTYVVGSP